MSLTDVKEILRVGKVGAPKSWLHTCAQLKHWTVVMATLLGTGHESVAWLLSLACLAHSKALVKVARRGLLAGPLGGASPPAPWAHSSNP
jgi:hypothetical protein